MNRQPNLIYIGTSKAGSTWLFDVLSRHPEVYMTPAKGLYFFDHHYEKGWGWYLEHFSDATDEPVVGEISHSYLYSEIACERIAAMDPDIKLMVCLREPIDRAFSMYLDGIRNGKWTGTFEERCKDTPAIVDEGCYGRHLERYLDRFPREQMHITLFDDLGQDPKTYAEDVFEALGISPMPLDPKLLTKVMPASLPRNKALVRYAKRMSEMFRRRRWIKLRGRVKRSRVIRSLLFRPLRDEGNAIISPETRAELKFRFQPEVERLDQLLGTQLCQQWGYDCPSKHPPLPSQQTFAPSSSR